MTETTTTPAYLTETAAKERIKDVAVDPAQIPENLRELVASGAIKASWDLVTVEVKGQKDRAARVYLRLDGATVEGMLALCGGRMSKVTEGENKGNGLLDYANYGWDLGVRSTERNALLATLEGPDAAIRRAIKGMVAAGVPEAIAKSAAVGALKESGKLPADYVLPADFAITTK